MINRCICFDILFSEILEKARKNDWSFEQVQEKLGCGSKCKLCKPYIKDCLKSGKTEFILNEKPNNSG